MKFALSILKKFFTHPNLALALRQSIFLIIIGKILFRFQITWFDIALVVVSGIVIEHLFIFLKTRKLSGFSYPSINAGLSTALMLGSTTPWAYVVGLAVGLGQKHFLRIKGEHFLNPSNVAIIVGLLVYYKYTFIHQAPLAETNLWWIAPLLYVSGFILLYKLKLHLVTISFIVFYSILQYLFFTHNVREILLMLGNGNFILYSLFMLTDPKAVPKTTQFRILFSFTAAFFAILFPLIWGAKFINLFLALFLAELLVPLWREVEKQ